MNPRRLHRSRDRQLAGVAGGMAEYLDIDPTVVRILWVIAGFASAGLALIAYVILALVMPQAEYATAPGTYASAPGGWAPAPGTWAPAPGGAAPAAGWGAPPAAPVPNQGWTAGAYAAPPLPQRAQGRGIGAAAIVGVVLIVFGAIALANVVVPGWVSGAILGPAVILALGAALLASSLLRRPDETPAPVPSAAAAPAPAESAAPAPAEPAAPVAAPWDVTDTQAVVDTHEGSRPA